MEHEKFKEQLILYSYNELKKEERNEFEKHLLACQTCKNELEELSRLHALIKASLVDEVNEDTLFEARQELLAEVRNLKRKKFRAQKIWDLFLIPTRTNLTVAYSLAAALGVIAFSFFFYFNGRGTTNQLAANSISDETKLTNLQFINSDFEKGEVDLVYEKVVPVRLKGNVKDTEIQKVLAKSLLDNENPGIRLKTVSAISSEQRDHSSGVLKEALINAVQHDNNPGVRKEAMLALCNLPFDEKISDAMIYVLQNDKNSGLRIQAINCLDEKNNSKRLSDPNIINVLKKKMQEDDNSYIKLRAKTMLTKLES